MLINFRRVIEMAFGMTNSSFNVAQKIKKLGTMIIKPGYFPNDPSGRPLQEQVEDLLTSLKIKVIATNKLTLTPEEIRCLYYGIFGNSEPSDRLTRLRKDLIDYMSTASIFCYLLYGEDVVNKVNTIKAIIRVKYGLVKGSLNVRTILHTPEEHDVMHDINLLFLYRTNDFDISEKIWGYLNELCEEFENHYSTI